MIKRVVDKPKQTTVKKFPEFDKSKIYVAETANEGLCILKKEYLSDEYAFYKIESSSTTLCGTKASFKELIEYVTGSKIHHTCKSIVYILDNQEQLARFIMGCREFPKVEEHTTIINEPLAEDEVSVEAVDDNKIIGFLYKGYPSIYNKGRVITIGYDPGWDNKVNLKSIVSPYLKEYYSDVYQFDSQDEFLRWSLEQVTGKTFKKIPPKDHLYGCNLVIPIIGKSSEEVEIFA